MFDSMKNGRVVIVLRGRFAGRKAVIVQTTDKVEGSGRSFGRALGIHLHQRVELESIDPFRIK